MSGLNLRRSRVLLIAAVLAWAARGIAAPVEAPHAGSAEEVLALTRAGKHHEAKEAAARLVAEAEARGDGKAAAKGLLLWADVEWELGDRLAYAQLNQRALAHSTRLGDEEGIGRALFNVAFEHYYDAPARMLEVLLQAREHAARGGNAKLSMKIENGLGQAYWSLGPYSAAIEHFARATEMARAAGDRHNLAVGEANVALMLERRGEHDKAIAAFSAAIATLRELGARPILGNQLGNLGEAYANAGEPERALALFEEGLAIQRQTGFKHSEAVLLGNIARLHWDLGEEELALRAAGQARELARSIGDARGELIELIDTAQNEIALGRLDEAGKLVDEAALLQAPLGDAALRIEWSLAAAASRPDAAASLPQATAARDEAAKLGDPYLLGRAEAARAMLFERRKQMAEARAAWSAAIAARERVAPNQELPLWRARLAALQAAAGDERAARAEYDASLLLIDRLDERLALDRFRVSLFRQTAAVYRAYAAWLAHRGDVRAAWAVAERGRARSLTRSALGRSAARELREAERDALSRLSDLQRQLDFREGSTARAGLLRQIDEAEQAYDRARLQAAQPPGASPGAQAARDEATPLPPLDLAPAHGALVVEYLVNGDELIVFSAAGGEPRVRFAAKAGELLERARWFAFRASRAEEPFALTDGDRALASALLGAELDASTRRLVIVADDSLHRLPFAALPDPRGGRFVGERVAVSFAPSLLALRRQPRQPTARSLAIASEGQPQLGMQALPHAADEAAMAARHLANAELLLAATEAQVKARDLRRYGVIHFATHAIFNDARPDRSAVVLGADDREDGLLQAREIYRLPLAANLVVLSSCESGVGSLVTGEGMLGLVHALLSAGSSAALASLWRVDDRATADLMERFYSRAGELSVADALQAAQAEAAAAGVHPARWAAFAVFGDADQSLPAARWPGRRVLFACALTMAAFAMAVLFHRRRSRPT